MENLTDGTKEYFSHLDEIADLIDSLDRSDIDSQYELVQKILVLTPLSIGIMLVKAEIIEAMLETNRTDAGELSEELEKVYEEAMELEPENPEVLLAYGRYLLRHFGRHDLAKPVLISARKKLREMLDKVDVYLGEIRNATE